MSAEAGTLDEAWAEAEAAMTHQYPSFFGDLIDRKRYDLSVCRTYETLVDGVEQYAFEARATLPGIHYVPAAGDTPAAALLALADALRAVPA